MPLLGLLTFVLGWEEEEEGVPMICFLGRTSPLPMGCLRVQPLETF